MKKEVKRRYAAAKHWLGCVKGFGSLGALGTLRYSGAGYFQYCSFARGRLAPRCAEWTGEDCACYARQPASNKKCGAGSSCCCAVCAIMPRQRAARRRPFLASMTQPTQYTWQTGIENTSANVRSRKNMRYTSLPYAGTAGLAVVRRTAGWTAWSSWRWTGPWRSGWGA